MIFTGFMESRCSLHPYKYNEMAAMERNYLSGTVVQVCKWSIDAKECWV